MKLYTNNNNWVIEDQLDKTLVEDLENIVNKNLNNLLKLKKGFSITGKNSEQYWIENRILNFYFDDKELQSVRKIYKDEILKKLKKSKLLQNRFYQNLNIENKYKNSWTVLGEENSFHAAHYHNQGNSNGISTILYLNVPKTNEENEPNNNVFFVLDSSSNNLWYSHEPHVLNINPKIGKLLIFPEWLVHGTYPQTKGIRQTFNQDYCLTNSTNSNFKYN